MSDYVLILIALIGFNIILTIFNRVALLNFVMGALSVVIGSMTLGSELMPFQPWGSLLVIFLGLICALSGAINLRSHGE